jgi:dihydrofolate reductase
MRKLIAHQIVSLDGFAADADGGLDFFDTITDFTAHDEDNLRMLEHVDTILLGSATYRMFVSYWPEAEHERIAPALNATAKAVVSSTLTSAPWGSWPDAEVLRGDGVEQVRALKQRLGKDIVLWGSLTLCRALLDAEEVDELRLLVCPVALGAGLRFFPERRIRFQLVDVNRYPAGGVLLRYERAAA